MIDSIRFVQRAVATKKFDPTLTHFFIQGGYVRGYNGSLGLCGPIECGLDMAPNAAQFIRAINACEDTIALSETKNRLCIKSGRFRTFVDCVEVSQLPDMEPAGQVIQLENPLLEVLTKLEPFIATDASRAWACGILLRGQSAFATNNISIVEYWLGYNFPYEVNIPHSAIKELIRIGEEPYALQFDTDRITFFFEGNRWLTTHTYALDWPDVYNFLTLDEEPTPTPVSPEFFAAVETLSAFTDELGRIYFYDGYLATGQDAEATTVAVETPAPLGSWNNKLLLSIRDVATSADFSKYPKPCPFFGDNIRGVMLGFR